jgi:hypothetical protein
MAETKPSGLPIVDGAAAMVTQEVAHIDQKGCLNLLLRWTGRLAWFPSPLTEEFEALIIFLEPGRLSVRNLRDHGPVIQERYSQLISEADSETLELLRLIQDRYGRLRIPISRRPSLGDPALSHLGIERGQKSVIYVAVFPNSIELLSPSYRNAKLIEFQERLGDLPFIAPR